MKKQVYNPYPPFWETIPDAQPHVFGDRLYIYGSHDLLGGSAFCTQDYVCWSAPIDDLIRSFIVMPRVIIYIMGLDLSFVSQERKIKMHLVP